MCIRDRCWALFLFSMLLLILVIQPISNRITGSLVAACGLGIAVSHYSTALITAGAIAFAWTAMELLRVKPKDRLIPRWIAVVIMTGTVAWEGFAAHIGKSISTLTTAISDHGLQLLPGSGNFISKWFAGAYIHATESVNQLQIADGALRKSVYRSMI